MNTKFKFGDRVRVLKNSVYNQEIGVVTKISNTPKPRYRVAFEDDLDLTFSESELELVPHPDTARLDWLEKNQFELGTYYDDDGLGFIDLRYVVYQPDKQGCRIKLSDEKSYRQTIDHAMQQEQTK